MADRKPPGHPSSAAVEHEFAADLERFSTDYSFNFSADDLESQQRHGAAAAAAAAARARGQTSDASFEMIAMGSPVMSKWRWIGEKELQYLVTNRRTPPPSVGDAELAVNEAQPSSSLGEGDALEKGAFVRVVTEGGGEPSLDSGGEGARQQQRIAHILLPTAPSPDEQRPSNAITAPAAAPREKVSAVGKKRKVSSVSLDESLDFDLEKGLSNPANADRVLHPPAAPPAPASEQDDWEEPLCRICHGTSASPMKSDVLELGCACKFDLGHAHSDCAETWFRVRGNRQCEICGETAQNVRLLDPVNSSPGSSLDTTVTVVTVHPPTACWQNRPIRNFLLIFLVTAFLVPWLFRFAYYQFSAK